MRRLQSSIRVGYRAGLDRETPKAPKVVGRHAAKATEAGRNKRPAWIVRVRISAARVSLPDLHESIWHGLAIAVEHATTHLEMLTWAIGCRDMVDVEPP
jgi:hypothetical protein